MTINVEELLTLDLLDDKVYYRLPSHREQVGLALGRVSVDNKGVGGVSLLDQAVPLGPGS